MLGEHVSRHRADDLVARGQQLSQRSLDLDPGVMRSSYNVEPFQFRHRVHLLPEFELPALFALCRRLPPDQVQFRKAIIPGDAEFDSSYQRYAEGLSLEDVLERFEENHAYICIYNPERDPAFRPLIESLLAEVAAATRLHDSPITWYSTYVFISTHDAVTPYHMDREMNFLIQVRGQKTVMLWDPHDDEIMSEADKDRLLAYDGARPTYQPSFESKAMRFDLSPGLAVHHPFIAPHRVHTGAQLSVSLALTFRTDRSDMQTRAHAFNQALRRRGLSPNPVGQSAVVDRAKAWTLRLGRMRHSITGRGQDAAV